MRLLVPHYLIFLVDIRNTLYSLSLLKELQEHSQIPLLRKIAKERQSLTPEQQQLLDLDVYASDLYNRILFSKTGIQRKNEYRQPLIIL